jgi:D-alanyl-D-alanine carboxypeptidase
VKRIALAIAALVLVGFVVTSTASAAALPSSIKKVMDGPRYRTASWSLYAADVRTGRPLCEEQR